MNRWLVFVHPGEHSWLAFFFPFLSDPRKRSPWLTDMYQQHQHLPLTCRVNTWTLLTISSKTSHPSSLLSFLVFLFEIRQCSEKQGADVPPRSPGWNWTVDICLQRLTAAAPSAASIILSSIITHFKLQVALSASVALLYVGRSPCWEWARETPGQ